MSDNENALFVSDAPRDPNWSFLAEIERLTAELALKDQALDEIKALHVEGREFVSFGAVYRVCACCDLLWPCSTAGILTRLDTQGETK